MIKCNVSNVAIDITETETLTAGRVGLECQFTFSSEWDGLAITAYFLGSTTKAVVVNGDTVTVPAESMAEPGYKLYVGVVGKNAQGNIVIPTLWASAGKIKRSPGEEEEATPSPDVVAQIQLMAMEALEKATYAKGVIDDNLEAITEAGETQTEAVNTEGSTQVLAIQTESSTQQAAIAAAAAAARESIPEDYTALSDDVDDAKSAINAVEVAANAAPRLSDTDADGVDLDVTDSHGNVLARFAEGHVRTKNFNSANTFPPPAPLDIGGDFAISDVNGNVLCLFENGQIRTRDFNSSLIRQLTGKKWTVLGDSLTEHNRRTTMNYHDYIADETGITVINLGHSGCGYAKVGGNDQTFVNQAENIPADTDVITIFGSGNDASARLNIGEPTDSGTTTICGYINATLDEIYSTHPTTPLGIITPTPWANREPSDGNSNWMALYSAAIIAICTRRGIPYLDLYHCSNLHPTDVDFRPLAYSKDDGDGVHPDETGHALIAPRIRQFLFSLI